MRDSAVSAIMMVAIKVGLKAIPFLIKLVTAKTSLGLISFGSYAVLLSWQFAAIIMAMLLIHEGGHLWAMKRCGMKTKGIYLIPFVGGAAVSESDFPTQKVGVFVALMGPFMGLVLAAGTALLYFATGWLLFAAAAAWMALINLLNLMPVNPFDGGRVLRSIAFSINTKVGLALLVVGCIACIALTVYQGIWLFAALILLGCFETVFAFRRRHSAAPMARQAIAGSVVAYLALAGLLVGLLTIMGEIPGAESALLFARD